MTDDIRAAIVDVIEHGDYALVDSFNLVVGTVLDEYLKKEDGVPAEMTSRESRFTPGKVIVNVKCGNCSGQITGNIFGIAEWYEYQKDHYKPNLPVYCPKCGYKVLEPVEVKDVSAT